MPHFHYQLIPCRKCAGEMYGPVAVKVEPAIPLADQIQSIETAVSTSHPDHQLNGHPLKRYTDFQLPRY